MAGRENPRDRINPVEVDPALFDDALHRWTDEEKKLPIEERLKIRPKFEKLPYQTPDDEKGLNPDELMQKKIKEMTPLGGDRYFNEEAIQEFDTKSNPRLTYEQPGENLLPPVNKADYWRQKIRIANSKKQSPDENIYKPLLDEYLIDLLTKNERRNSRSAMDFDRTSARGDEGQKRNYDLMKSISDFGASFANRRYSDPNAPIPTSGFEPEGLKKSQDLLAQRMDVMGQKKDQRTGINADVLKYLSEKRAAEIQKAKEEQLKRDLAAAKGKDGAMSEYQRAMLAQRKKEFDAKMAASKAKEKEKRPNRDFRQLPVEKQEIIKDTAKTIAVRKKIAIDLTAQLKQVEAAMEAGNEDQAVQLGNQMIKTLNSTQGQDAVGAEEAQRLSGFLQFKLFNVTEPGSIFGRDMPDFIISARSTIKGIEEAARMLEDEIQKNYGREPPDSKEKNIYDKLMEDYSKEPEGTPRKKKLEEALNKLNEKRSQERP